MTTATVRTARRSATVLLGGAALAAVTAACSSGTTATAGSGSTTAASPSASVSTAPGSGGVVTNPSASTSGPPHTKIGTTVGGGSGIPAGAGTATTVDLDGDGAPDTLWLADVDGKRELGVATTAHGGSSVEFSSAAPQAATASAALLSSGAPAVFLNTGRSVQLYVYRTEDQGLVPVKGVDGNQYSFSLGFTDYGTGLACESRDDGLHLFGENAISASGNVWTVDSTEVTVSAEHSSATNGVKTSVTGLTRDDPRVDAAHGTTCGDVADSAIAREPV